MFFTVFTNHTSTPWILSLQGIFRRIIEINERPTIIFIIFGDSLMFKQIFLSPKVKRCAIITYNHVIYQLPNELQNDLQN